MTLLRSIPGLSAVAAVATVLLLTGCETRYNRPPPVAGYPAPPPNARSAPPGVSYPRPEPWVDVSIKTPERQVIQGYVASQVIEEQYPRKGKKPKGLPPGLQKKLDRGGSLPPGWEMKFRKGEILPVEIYEQCHPLPREIAVKLPPSPPGTVLITVGGKVGRILAATREILDVFEVEF